MRVSFEGWICSTLAPKPTLCFCVLPFKASLRSSCPKNSSGSYIRLSNSSTNPSIMVQSRRMIRRVSKLPVRRYPFSPLLFTHTLHPHLVQCIGEAFGVDPSKQQQVDQLSVKPATLQTIFDVFIKTRDKIGPTAQLATPSSSSASTSKPKTPSAADKAQADKFKQSGNTQMSSKQFDDAIESYNKAIALDPTNAVYYSNRAAAYSSKGDHLAAVGDAEQAISVDPQFIKAYHRLGFVSYAYRATFILIVL
jgi:tetratricopeptide (TPR) repeat protein